MNVIRGVNAKWMQFGIGQIVSGARITGIAMEHTLATRFRYNLRWLCCDKEDILTHFGLLQRAIRGAFECKNCASARARAENKAQGTTGQNTSSQPKPLPSTAVTMYWPAPPSTIALRKRGYPTEREKQLLHKTSWV